MRDRDPRALGLRTGFPPFLLGFLAATFQIFLLREFSARFYGNELTLGLLLGSWLLWGGLGSFVRPRATDRLKSGRLFGLYAVVILLVLAALVALRLSHRFLGLLPTELVGVGSALGAALLLGLVVSFPLGHAFVLNATLVGGDVPLVYLLESAGAAAGGLVVQFLLVPRLSNWQGTALIGATVATVLALTARQRPPRALAAIAFASSLALAGLDVAAERAAWKPLRLVEAVDTRYGKIQVVRTGDQVTLYNNGLRLFSSPGFGAAEDPVHFALLQREGAREVLLIGGAAGGAAAEALKHPGVRLDCVELDPTVIRTAERHLPSSEIAALRDPRVRVVYQDGRSFLIRSDTLYDAILLDLPEPATAQINRYYTLEFFEAALRRLKPGGVLSFVVPSAENYISPSLALFLRSLSATLRAVFPEVEVVPGGQAVFLASDRPLSVDPERLSQTLDRLGLRNRAVSPDILPFRLTEMRRASLAAKIKEGHARINRDLVPVSYFFHSMLWADHFRGAESRLLLVASRIPRAWLLDVPLAVAAAGLVLLLLRGTRARKARLLAPIAIMGLTSIVVEAAVFISFQANFGYVYGEIALLLAMFMAGLTAGAFLARKRERPRILDLALIEGGFVALLGLTWFALPGRGGEVVPFILMAGYGALGGLLFGLSSRLLVKESRHLGLGYGVDLTASFLGVVLASALIIPLWGIPALVVRLAVLNALSAAVLFMSDRS